MGTASVALAPGSVRTSGCMYQQLDGVGCSSVLLSTPDPVLDHARGSQFIQLARIQHIPQTEL